MLSDNTLTPFELSQMRAQTFAISLLCCTVFTESLKVLEVMKDESQQVSRSYRASEGDIREGHKVELTALIDERKNLLTTLLSHPIETGV